MTCFRYQGDIDLTEGGYFFSVGADEQRNHYSSVVRVTPCSDAGGPANCFWVETLTALLPHGPRDAQRLDNTFQVIGMTHEKFKRHSRAARFAILVDACMAYGCYDPDDIFSMDLPQSQLVQIGKDDEYWHGAGHSDTFTPNTILRGNTNLRRWIQRTYLKG